MIAAKAREAAVILDSVATCPEHFGGLLWHEILAKVFGWEGDARDHAARYLNPEWVRRHDLILWAAGNPDTWGNEDGALVFSSAGEAPDFLSIAERLEQ
jgi:hypothetical protein